MVALSNILEQLLADSAAGTLPSIGERLEGCSWRDTVIRIPFERVIDIAADGASPFVHGVFPLPVRYCDPILIL